LALKTLKWVASAAIALVVLGVGYYAYSIISFDTETLPETYGRVHTLLYAGAGENQPLIVGLGGAEGGNAWIRTNLKPLRDRLLGQGYAVLALAYFGEEGIPKELDRISVDAVHDAILAAARDPRVNSQCIAVIGGSKGAELALLLASNYADIKAVVGVVPGHAVFPAHTLAMNTASFAIDGEPLPFVPVPWGAVPALIKRDLRGAWVEMLKDHDAVDRSAIAIERINGPLLLISATRDEYWPSTEMSKAMIARLEANGFGFLYEHVAVDGDHGSPQQRGDLVEEFLRANFLPESDAGCPR
jgi:dienelactone hydrolase